MAVCFFPFLLPFSRYSDGVYHAEEDFFDPFGNIFHARRNISQYAHAAKNVKKKNPRNKSNITKICWRKEPRIFKGPYVDADLYT